MVKYYREKHLTLYIAIMNKHICCALKMFLCKRHKMHITFCLENGQEVVSWKIKVLIKCDIKTDGK